MKTKTAAIIIVVLFSISFGIGAAIGISNQKPLTSAQSPTSASGQTQQLETASQISFAGQKIAGSDTTPYLRFNRADYEKARSTGKVIYLYYYADWCSICAAERPRIFSAFEQLGTSDAVGFEVHFSDSWTTDEDVEVAREFGVFSQHTHVYLDRHGEVVHKSLTPSSSDEIRSRIEELVRL